MTTVTFDPKGISQSDFYWDQAANWSTGSLPGAGDAVVIPAKFDVLVEKKDSISIASLDLSGGLGIDGGTFSTTGGLTIEAGAGFEIDAPPPDTPDYGNTSPATVTIGGVFSNSGGFIIGSTAHVTIGTVDNAKTGSGVIGGSVTVTNLINDGGQSGDFGASGGGLDVTGTLTNSGLFHIGVFGELLDSKAETMSMAALDNGTAGEITINSAVVKIGDVDNQAVETSDNPAVGIYVDFEDGVVGDQGSLFHVTGTFKNAGSLVIGGADTGTTAIIATLDNEATGSIGIDDAAVTVDNVTNAGRTEGDTFAGFGVNYHAGETTGFETGGSLTVTGKFVNTGDFAVGDVNDKNVASATTVTIATLDNEATGGINILAGTVTVTTLNNAGAPSDSVPHAGAGIDNLPRQPGGGTLKVTGVLTNTGGFKIGNDGMTGSATVTAGTLANSGGTIELVAGAASSHAELELQTTPAVWQGTVSLAGGTSGIAGTALLEMEDNGQINAIALNGAITLIGDKAFVADANDTSANSALGGLTTVDGGLDLEQGAEVTVSGGLANNGALVQAGGIGVDYDDYSAGSSLAIVGELTNNGDIGIGNIDAKAADNEVALTVGGLDNTVDGSIGIINTVVEVRGDLINAGVGTDKGIGLDIVDKASGGSLTVDGTLFNSGVIGIGNASDGGLSRATLGALDITETGSIGVTDAVLTVTGDATNAGVGIGMGIGVDLVGPGGATLTVDGALANAGDIAIGHRSAFYTNDTTVSLGSLDNEATGSIAIDSLGAGAPRVTVTGTLTNAGVGSDADIENGIGVDSLEGAAGSSLDVKGQVTNSGMLGFGNPGDNGSTRITLAGGLDNKATGAIEIMNAAVFVTGNLTNAGVGTDADTDIENGLGVGTEDGSTSSGLSITGALVNSGDMQVGDLGQARVSAESLTNTGLVDIDFGSKEDLPLVDVDLYTQAAGSPGLTNVDGVLEAPVVSITGGTIDGAGLIVGAVENTGGNVQAGQNLTTPGTLTVGGHAVGSYTQGKLGTLSELVAGIGTGQFGVLDVNGPVALAGALAIVPVNGFTFAAGQSFDIVNFTDNKLTGTFAAIDFGAKTGNSHEVLIGGGLAIVADYDSAKGQIDLDVVSTKASVATFESEEPILNQIGTSFIVVDTAQNIEAGLAALEGDVAHIKSVSLTGASPVLDLTGAQAEADAALLKRIGTPYVLNITNSAAMTGEGNELTIVASGADDSITARGSGETFVLHGAFGQVTITDFAARDQGAGHDVISLPTTDFRSFTAVLGAASNAGRNVVIAAQGGDKLTLDNLSVSALRGLAADFRFHA
jgi:hypothetical protein